ncbi:hypothetical protein QBC34DRAFT_401201 [Podospora aff. communis PSN243]|uniref:Nucleotide exchange factor SIL1 n=1 Tax=Podospora aff. communis PSN243 TaxID=3040156 RepID=A0AAV9GUX4_9PEZI|nr:hypothetical protein QBC34DRAFT_401201 [Podospora aff. communis PSN243]
MAKLRLRALPLTLLALIGVAASGVAASSPSPRESAVSPSPAPSDENELVCHTDNPAECYPKVFQPTDEFQLVHEDQDLPKGLHVRLDVQTGRKMAKINIPDEVNPALEGLPVDKAVVIVDPEEAEEKPGPPKIPANAPGYEPVGKIKEPKNPNSEEGSAFYRSLSILKKGLNIDEALEMLEDISHDIYYGLKITEDLDTVRQLFCLANTPAIFESADDTETVLSRARVAALTIGSAVQNNPKALAEIERHWATLEKEKCSGSEETLGTAAFRLVPPASSVAKKNDPSLAKVRISAISGLLKNDAIRKQFLGNGGMELLLEVLVGSEDPDWEPAQKKVGYLILDNFLDEDMGAALGEWPRGGQAKDAECEAKSEVHKDCWDWHAQKLAKRFKSEKGHWSAELLKKLKEQRKANGASGAKRKGRKDEL